MGADLSASEEMVLVDCGQNCTTIAPKENPAEAGFTLVVPREEETEGVVVRVSSPSLNQSLFGSCPICSHWISSSPYCVCCPSPSPICDP